MELVPAPLRQFKTWSMWLLIATGVFDLATLLLKTMSDLHVMSPETILTINAVMVFLTGVVRLIHQNISVTTDEKVQIVTAAAAQPMKAGEPNVAVMVSSKVVPSTPKEVPKA